MAEQTAHLSFAAFILQRSPSGATPGDRQEEHQNNPGVM